MFPLALSLPATFPVFNEQSCSLSLSLLCDPLFSSAREWDHLVFLLFNLTYYSYDFVLQLHRHYQNGRMPVFLD
jgi:hypothetical protein